MASGILGLTAIQGFLFYTVFSAYLSVLLAIKYHHPMPEKRIASSSTSSTSNSTRRQHTGKYVEGWGAWMLDGVLGNGLSFVLFWTLFYGLVHVYD